MGVNTEVKKYHKSRRMFCIYKGKLYIAKPNLDYSHYIWFKKEGWVSTKKDGLINEIVRGIIDDEGNISFYIGNDFEINKEVETIFFSNLKKITKKMELDTDAEIFGGAIKQKPGEKWPPRKKYGKIKNFSNLLHL
jgi:hypothetical protein